MLGVGRGSKFGAPVTWPLGGLEQRDMALSLHCTATRGYCRDSASPGPCWQTYASLLFKSSISLMSGEAELLKDGYWPFSFLCSEPDVF